MTMKPLWILFVLFLNSSADEDTLIVKTTKGPVKGITLTSEAGKPVDAFLGIPYGQAPISKLRFKPSLPVEPWTGTLDVSKNNVSCYFLITEEFEILGETELFSNLQFSEDCLKLNVWVPVPRPKKAAVMVWIHGGGLYSESASLDIYDMKILASEENVICVSMNYRTNSFGFLYLAHPDAPGNAGLFDQALALQWVKENIEAFGGDPDRITIFGESAGSVSVTFHLLSPISRNFFNRAILQSGLMRNVNNTAAIQNGLNLAKSINCPNDPNQIESIIECFQRKSPTEVAAVSFLPVVDGVMIPESPDSAMKNHRFKQTDILLGTTKDEGSMDLVLRDPSLFTRDKEVHLTRSQFLDFVKEFDPIKTPVSQKAIVFEYTHWPDPEDGQEMTNALVQVVGERLTCRIAKAAHEYAEAGNNVFHYEFRRVDPERARWIGSFHGAELLYTFGKTLDKSKNYSTEEMEFNKRMLRYWSNFANTGNPNTSPSGETESIHWPVYTTSGREYLALLNDSDKPHRALRARKCAFWDQYLPDLIELTGFRKN